MIHILSQTVNHLGPTSITGFMNWESRSWAALGVAIKVSGVLRFPGSCIAFGRTFLQF